MSEAEPKALPEVSVAVREAVPGAQAKGGAESGSAGGRCPGPGRRESWLRRAREGFWLPDSSSVLTGGEDGRDRGCHWWGRLGVRSADNAGGCPIRESRRPLRGETIIVVADDAVTTTSFLRVGDAACGYPAPPWTESSAQPHVGAGVAGESRSGGRTGV